METYRNVDDTRSDLEVLRYACVRLMEISAGVLVRIPATAAKVALSRDVWALAQAADLIGGRLPGLRSARGAVTPTARYIGFTNGILECGDPARQFALLKEQAFPELRDAVSRQESRVHRLADEASAACLKEAADRLEVLSAVSEGTSPAPAPNALDLDGDREAEGLPPEVPALAEIPRRPGRSPSIREGRSEGKGLIRILHDMIFGIEICAAEICAAIIAHHPEAPWELRFDMAKQVRDEGRHFEIMERRIRELGGGVGDHPVTFDVWDKFALGRTLAERINIEQRMGEGVGLDGGKLLHGALVKAGDAKTALLFDYINADEVTHVGNGNRWLRELVGGDDAVAELDAEVERLLKAAGWETGSALPLNIEDRLLAGFTEAELAHGRSG